MKPRKSSTWRMAKLLVKHAGNILPPERENWAQAMCNEIDHLPDSRSALGWAIGCMFTCYKERMTRVNTGSLRISRAVFGMEMLLCFGFLSLAFFGMLFRIGNSLPVNGSLISIVAFSSCLTGPIGLIFAFRLLVFNRTDLSKAMLAALIIPVTSTLIVNGIVMWVLAGRPLVSWAWEGTLLMAILPALGVAHLIYMSSAGEA